MSVCLSVCPPPVTFERFNIFEIRFRYSSESVICRFKFVFKMKSDGPFRSTVKGHVNFNCIAPSCEVSLERSSKGLSSDAELRGPVTVV
jgi:hypothetical protein